MAGSPVGKGTKSVGRVSIRVVPDATKFRNDLKLTLQRIEKSSVLKIKVDADMTPAERTIQRWRDHWSGQTVNLNVDVNGAALTSGRIAALTRPRVVPIQLQITKASLAKVGTVLASLSGARLLGDAGRKIGSALSNLDRSLPKLAAVASGVATLATSVIAAGGGLVTVGAGLASIAPLALLLPGMFAGAAIGAGVLVVALSSAKDELAELGPAFTGLKSVIQGNFWEQARQPILDLANSVLPALNDNLGATAQSLGRWTGSLASAFQGALAGDTLYRLFETLNESIDIAAGGLASFADTIVTLGLVGSSYLPNLAQWLNDIGERFNTFISTAESDGSLVEWIDAGILALQQLGSITASTGRILNGLFTAAEAAGGGGLATLATVLQQVADVVNGPAFQTGLTTIFAGAAEGASGLAAALGPIGSMLSTLAPTLSDILSTSGVAIGDLLGQVATALEQPAFQTGLSDFFTGIQEGLLAIGPALPAVAEALGSLGTFAGALAEQLGPVLNVALQQLAPILQDVLDALLPLLPSLSETLIDAIVALAPPLTDLIVTLLPPLVQLLIGLAPVIVIAADAVATLIDWLMPLIRWFSEGIDSLGLILQAFSALTNGGVQPFMEKISQVTGFARTMVDAISGLATGLRSFVLSAMSSLAGAAQTALGTVRGFANGVVNAVNSAIGLINGALSGLSAVGINVQIPGVPNLATGATILPTEGGTLVRVAEAGRAESVVDRGLMNSNLAAQTALMAQVLAALKRSSSGTVVQVISDGPGLDRFIKVRIVENDEQRKQREDAGDWG